MMGEIGLYTPLGTTWYHLVPLQSAKWYPCFNVVSTLCFVLTDPVPC